MLKPKSPLKSFYGYYGTGGNYDTTGGYYGRLWRIGVNDGEIDLMDVRHTWDAGGNLATRQDVLASETETFGYDFLDRLTSVSGAYSASFSYDEIGNILTRNGVSYSYDGTQPHAVDSVGGTSYSYDNNGNMTARGSQTITWDQENRPVSVSGGGTATFVYDGDGNRVKKTESGETTLYLNRYYEKNLTTGNITTSYYLGGRLVAQREGTALRYIHQDHLTGTSLMTDTNGDPTGSIKYYPYGSTRSGSVPTDKKFTGQRLDDTGLYYYGARYYDASIGRFISADTIISNPFNPQAYNRYSYCLNNPLKYTDASGHVVNIHGIDINDIDYLLLNPELLMMVGSSEVLGETFSSSEYQAYTQFRQDYSVEAATFEKSALKYSVSSESASTDDMHIINTQGVEINFTLLPFPEFFGHGSAKFSVESDWHQGKLNISVYSSIMIIQPTSSVGIAGAEVSNINRIIKMHPPEGPFWGLPNTSYSEGTISIDICYPTSPLTVKLTIDAWTMSNNIGDPPYHRVIPHSKTITIWEGK